MKISEVKQEYQLQEWSGMLRKLRQMACNTLEQAQPIQLAEVPLAPKAQETHAKLRLTTKAGTLEIMDADRPALDQVLRAMLHAE